MCMQSQEMFQRWLLPVVQVYFAGCWLRPVFSAMRLSTKQLYPGDMNCNCNGQAARLLLVHAVQHI